jgi:hypothetical protein
MRAWLVRATRDLFEAGLTTGRLKDLLKVSFTRVDGAW